MNGEGPERGTWELGTTGSSGDDPLSALLESHATSDLEAALDRLDERVSTWEDSVADEVLDEAIEALLDALSGADDAPLTWRSLHRRVHAGVIGWPTFWADPAREPGGPALVTAVLRAQVAAVPDLVEQARRALREAEGGSSRDLPRRG